MKNSSYKPLLIWILLWIVGNILIGLRNDFKLQGHLSSSIDVIVASLGTSIIIIPIALIVWFIAKFIFNKLGKSQILNGQNAVRNAVILWLVLFGSLFLYGFTT